MATNAWRAILLNYGKDAKSTHLETAEYKKDTAGEMESFEKNTGLTGRLIKNQNLSNSTGDNIPILVFKIDILLIM
jgi:hypothetical protein